MIFLKSILYGVNKMESMLFDEIKCYWTSRVGGYSQVNRQELATGQDKVWLRELKKHLPQKRKLKILDVGTGPGFFAIILAREGYDVTAVDCTKAMLHEAKRNAGKLRERINFMLMDAQKLEFEDKTFDVVISRNLTWNLEDPEAAYSHWVRVLKKDGIILNFDANWYRHLYDEDMRKGYESDRKKTADKGKEDLYTCTDINTMEDIAKRVPLSNTVRPSWDKAVLEKCGIDEICIDEHVWKNVWDSGEKLNCSSTPMFLVKGKKK